MTAKPTQLSAAERDALTNFVANIGCDELENDTAAVIKRLENLMTVILATRRKRKGVYSFEHYMFVAKHYLDRSMSVEQIAERCDIPLCMVGIIARRMGLPPRDFRVRGPHKRGIGWSQEEERRLLDLVAAGHRYSQIGLMMNRTRQSVKGKHLDMRNKNHPLLQQAA